jgi:O-antigen ligase
MSGAPHELPWERDVPVIAAIAAAAGLVWGAIYARRGSLVLGGAALIIIGYALGHTFWHAKIGPVTLTLDRMLLVGVIAAFVVQWRFGSIESKPLTGCDWVLAGLLSILTLSALTSGTPEVVAPDGGMALWRLTMSFLVPAGLYWIVRQAPLPQREWKGWLAAMSVLGIYLAVTACAEISRQWWLVFPHYISDPTLGIHFGRARGPDLNSASLGIYLVTCLWATWILRPYVRPISQLALFVALPLIVVGVFFTYTRSTWIGLLASGTVVGALQVPRHLRLPAFAMAALVGGVLVTATWSNVVDLEREGSGQESHHSIDQRKSFTYVSWQMFKDNPIFGVGFGRFYDRKLPYLSDRSQDFELESLRPLHHHNTLLSLLTETGMIGLAAFIALLVAWVRMAWSLAKDANVPPWARGQGVLMLATIATYLSSAAFHDLTLLPLQHWLLFMMAGLTLNLRLSPQFATGATSEPGTSTYMVSNSILSGAAAGAAG